MPPVHVLILHPAAADDAGPLTRAVADARARLAERHRDGFLAAGATTARIVSGPRDDRSFGARLATLAEGAGISQATSAGLVVLGSGAVPLIDRRERARFVDAAASTDRRALANNAFSADVVAVSRAAEALADLPEAMTDNAWPRWLAEIAGYTVTDRRARWRLGLDIDGPLDLVILGRRWATPLGAAHRTVVDALSAVRTVAADPRAELIVAGRTSAATLRWLEQSIPARTRALVEERGLRTSTVGQRPAASILASLLERDGPAALGTLLARFGDAAVIDSRVLLAHRLGSDERRWPSPEDRFASDLLLPDRIADPWLRALTAAAADGPIPIVLGAHGLVGPGLRLALRPRPGRAPTQAAVRTRSRS